MKKLSMLPRLRKSRSPISSGFTLVELIVVITILVILGTIAFLSFGGYSASARDSARIENLSNLHKGLLILQIKAGAYPMPDAPVNITASGTIIAYQGFAKEQVGTLAGISKWGTVDPADPTIYTTYLVNASLNKMQLMAFLEDGNNVTSYIPEAFAAVSSDYSKRYPSTKGDSLGILLANTGAMFNQPIQETGTGVDVVSTNSSYSAYFSNTNSISGTGQVLKSMRAWGDLAYGLVGFWGFDEGAGTVAYDNSGNGNTCTFVWGVSWTGGVLGGSIDFNGTSGYLNCGVKNILKVRSSITLVTSIKARRNEARWILSMQQAGWSGCSDWLSGYCGYQLQTQVDLLGARLYDSLDPFNYASLDRREIAVVKNYNDGTWYQIVYTAKNGEVGKVYINGKRLPTDRNRKISNITTSDNPLLIGRYWNSMVWGIYEYFDGAIDEVRIYNRALSDSEVQSLYNATK